MFKYIVSIVLLGLGIQSPVINPNVKGVTTEVHTATASTTTTVSLQHTLEVNRAAVAAKVTANHEMFQSKLAGIKDTKKRTIVENVQNRITEINTNRIDTATKHLATMKNLLDKISAKALEVQKNGKDITSVTTAIATAQTAIDDAMAAVASQASKVYTIPISTENTLRNSVFSTRKSLETDILAMHQKVVTARTAVYNAIKALAIVRGEKVPEAIIK
jgi:hypothetical protein